MSIKPEELKPCPFCGGSADYAMGGREAYNHYIMCQQCGAQSRGSAFRNDTFNAKEWNTRAIPDPHRVVSVELLKEAVGQLSELNTFAAIRAIIEDKP